MQKAWGLLLACLEYRNTMLWNLHVLQPDKGCAARRLLKKLERMHMADPQYSQEFYECLEATIQNST